MYKSPLEEMMGTGLHEMEYKAGTEGAISDMLGDIGITAAAVGIIAGGSWLISRYFKSAVKGNKSNQSKTYTNTKENPLFRSSNNLSVPLSEDEILPHLNKVSNIISGLNKTLKGKEKDFPFLDFICLLNGIKFKINVEFESSKSDIIDTFKHDFMNKMTGSDYITDDGKIMFYNIRTCNIPGNVVDFYDLYEDIKIEIGKNDKERCIISFKGPKKSATFVYSKRNEYKKKLGSLGDMIWVALDEFEEGRPEETLDLIQYNIDKYMTEEADTLNRKVDDTLRHELGLNSDRLPAVYVRPGDGDEWDYMTTFIAIKRKEDEVGAESVASTVVGTEGIGALLVGGALVAGTVFALGYVIRDMLKKAKENLDKIRGTDKPIESNVKTPNDYIRTCFNPMTEKRAADHLAIDDYIAARRKAISECRNVFKKWEIGPFFEVFRYLASGDYSIDIRADVSEKDVRNNAFKGDYFIDKIKVFKDELTYEKFVDEVIDNITLGVNRNDGVRKLVIYNRNDKKKEAYIIPEDKINNYGEEFSKFCKLCLDGIHENTSYEVREKLYLLFINYAYRELWRFMEIRLFPDFKKCVNKYAYEGWLQDDGILYREPLYKEEKFKEEAIYIPIIYSEDELEWINELD